MRVTRWFRWRWARRATAILFLTLLAMGTCPWFPWFKGSTTSTRLLEAIPLADPLAAVEITLATRQWQPHLVIGAALLIGFCLLMGPVFCGWVCPLGFLLDLLHSIRSGVMKILGRTRRARVPGRLPSSLRYAVLGFMLAVSLTARVPAFQAVSPINLVGWSWLKLIDGVRRLGFIESGSAIASAIDFLGAGAFVLIGIFVAELAWPRVWCRCLCPLGALYGWAGRTAPWRARIDTERAGRARCARCERHCPMGIRVMEDYEFAGRTSIDHPDCTRCGACIDSCPRGVLHFGFFNEQEQSEPPA